MRESKFNVSKDVSKRTYNDIVFDSQKEMEYYRDVILPELGITIESFEMQKHYELQPSFRYNETNIRKIEYVADFYIKYIDGREEVIDIKGFPDSIAILKKKLFHYKYPEINYEWICYSKIDGGWCKYEYVKQQRAIRKKVKKEKDKEKKRE